MKNIKNVAYGIGAAVAALAPVMVSAQSGWERGLNNANDAGTPGGSIMGILASTMNWLLAIFGFLGIIGFVISGILYLTAAGDEGQAEKAKNAMMYSIIGVIVALLGFVIILAVDSWLNASNTF